MSPYRGLAFCVLASIVMVRHVEASVEFLDARGKLAPASEMTSLLSGLGGQPMKVVSVLGSKGSGKSTLLNQAFGTAFPVGGVLEQAPNTGISAAVCDGLLLLDCDGAEDDPDPTAESKGTTAGQATALSAALSDVVLVNMWSSDLGRSVASNVRTLKTLFSEKLQDAEGAPEEPLTLMVLVHDCDPGADAQSLEAEVLEEMQATWQELDYAGSLEHYFTIEAIGIPHPRYHAKAYAKATDDLRAKLNSVEGSTVTTGFREKVTQAWTAVRRAEASVLPAKSELVAIYMVDAAYGDVLAKIDTQLRTWRQAVGSGKVVPQFGQKASHLYTSSLKTFGSKTVRFSTTNTRVAKRNELVEILETGINELYARQLVMLCSSAEKSYRTSLLKLWETDQLHEDAEANILRKTLFAFEADATALASEALSHSFEDEYEELEADLQEFSEKFPESPAAQAKAVQKMDNKVKKPRGERSVGFGLGLVGMVRQDGYGNLQGFGGYRMGPHTITMGYANDASLQDSSYNGRKPPLLRLQPKLNIDIDL